MACIPPSTAAAPAHVDLHVLHALAGLDRQAATVEGDSLAHQDQRSGAGILADVLQHDEARLLGAALGHAQQRAEALVGKLHRPEHPALQTALVRQIHGPVGQRRGREVVGRLVDQIARQTGGDAENQRAVERHLQGASVPSVPASSVTASTTVSSSSGCR